MRTFSRIQEKDGKMSTSELCVS